MKTIKLHNGYSMPIIGLGTYNIKKDEAFDVVLNALKLGYRHLETAPIYLNETAIQHAIKASDLDRDALFITSKVPPHIKTYEGTLRVVERSMKKLGTDYLDAVLINNPVPWGEEGSDYSKENIDVYKALETLYNEEKVGAIGVSNFAIADLEKLLPYVTVKPHINQIAIFIGHTLDKIRQYCKAQNIIVQGHSPLARGRLLSQPYIIEQAKKLHITKAQLALKYVLDKGVYPVVKAATPAHLTNNLDLDFIIPQSVMQALDAVNNDVRDYKPPKAQYIL